MHVDAMGQSTGFEGGVEDPNEWSLLGVLNGGS